MSADLIRVGFQARFPDSGQHFDVVAGEQRLDSTEEDEALMAVPALYWRSLQMASQAIESENDIWGVIKAKMQEAGLSGVKKNPSDVNGHSQDTIVAVTFVKLAPKDPMLIIMAAGSHALQLRDQVYNKLKSVKFL